MIISIQIPFADSRRFLLDTNKLLVPGWPLPTPDSEFVRYFGIIRKQRSGSVSGWGSEGTICTANKAVQFGRNFTHIIRTPDSQLSLRSLFKKLYFDGHAVGKIELGVGSKKTTERGNNSYLLSEIFKKFLETQVHIKEYRGKQVETNILRMGKPLVSL